MAELAHLSPGDRPRRPLLRTVVGQVLRRHRMEQRRTLAEVAQAACVSVPYLSEVERGRKEPSSEVIAAVCDSLQIELADLLAEVRSDLVVDRAILLRLDTSRRSAANPRWASPTNSMQLTPPSHRAGNVTLLAA